MIVSLSLDTTAIAATADPFQAMRVALGLENARHNDANALTPRQVLEMATHRRRACRWAWADVTGSITPGKRADIVLVARRPAQYRAGGGPGGRGGPLGVPRQRGPPSSWTGASWSVTAGWSTWTRAPIVAEAQERLVAAGRAGGLRARPGTTHRDTSTPH